MAARSEISSPPQSGAWIWGVDPGKRGALAVIRSDSGELSHLVTFEPDIEFWHLAMGFAFDAFPPAMVVVERQWGRPGSAAPSVFMLGVRFGWIESWFSNLGQPFELVPPATWTKWIGKPAGSGKKWNAEKARELCPNKEERVTQVNADSVIIAHYGKDVLWPKR